MQGQQGIHRFAANENGCGYSVKQVGTPICVPARECIAFLRARNLTSSVSCLVKYLPPM